MTPILTITGSDNTGFSGLQQDIRIISEMGGHAMTCTTFEHFKLSETSTQTHFLMADEVDKQLKSVLLQIRPKAVKIGLVYHADTARSIARELVGCRSIVLAPGFIFSDGIKHTCEDTYNAIMHYLVPMASIVVLRCNEAKLMLGMDINTDEDMKCAANAFLDMGAQYVLLRGGKITNGMVTALLAGTDSETFFSSYFVEGWQHHGVGGALAVAIATRLGLGDDVPAAVRNAHEYVHSRVVYIASEEEQHLRPADIYNSFMTLIADNYTQDHNVWSYAQRLNVSTRYLALVTCQTVKKSPKQVINDYLMEKARQMLMNSRLSIKEIAFTLGFTTNPVFCKFFKQQEGKTPNEFRKSVESLP